MSQLPKLIGIRGKVGVGKDTAADFIIRDGQLRGVEYIVVPFASAVKLVTSIITSTSNISQYTREGKASTPQGLSCTLGRYQQIIGESMRERIHPEVWVRIAIQHPAEYKIIPDVRYENEVLAIEAAGGIVINITRSITTCDQILNDGRDRNHSSETTLDNYSFKHSVINDGSLDELQSRVLAIVSL